MKPLAVFALMLILSDFNAFAVTEYASEGPKSACEAELVPDAFYRLIARALEHGLLTAQDLKELGQAEAPSNPLARRLKVNPALLKALDKELAKMTPERWAGLRPKFVELAARTAGENSARAESREETAEILKLKELKSFRAEPDQNSGYMFERPSPEFFDQSWFQRGDETLLVLRSTGKSKDEVFSAPSLKVANLYGVDVHDLNGTEYVSTENGWLWDQWTWDGIGKADPISDTGFLHIANKGIFAIHEKHSSGEKYHLTVRKLGSWRWVSRLKNHFTWPSMSVAVASTGGEDDGYILVRHHTENAFSLIHFDGKNLTPIWETRSPYAKSLNWEFKRDQTGRVYLLASTRDGWQRPIPSFLVEIDRVRVQMSTVLDPKKAQYVSVRFWRDLDGRLCLFGFENTQIMLRCLDEKGSDDLILADAPLKDHRPIQPFQFNGAYHLLALTTNNRLVAVNLKTSSVAAEFGGEFPSPENLSLHQSSNGQVYLLAKFAKEFVRLYTLTSRPGGQ